MKSIRLCINMEPLPHKETAVGRGVHYTPKAKRDYILSVLEYIREWHPGYQFYFQGCKFLSVEFFHAFTRKKNNSGNSYVLRCDGPDMDNLEKTMQDCLQDKPILKEKSGVVMGSGIIDDDKHIVIKTSRKVWAPSGVQGHTIILITQVTQIETQPP